MTLLDVDPNVVKPGWLPLILVIVLAAVMTLLFFSMRRQMRKIRVPYVDELPSAGDGQAEQGESDPSNETDRADALGSAGSSQSGSSGSANTR